VEVRNHGWEDDAANCMLSVILVGTAAVPVTTFCAPEASELGTIPHKGRRRYIVCLVDSPSGEAVFCTWAFPQARRPAYPSWQLRVPLGAPMRLLLTATADNAVDARCEAWLTISRNEPHHVTVAKWR
jgi:hypothetical protein